MQPEQHTEEEPREREPYEAPAVEESAAFDEVRLGCASALNQPGCPIPGNSGQ